MQSRQAGQPQAAQARGLGLMVATMRSLPAFERLLRRFSTASHLPSALLSLQTPAGAQTANTLQQPACRCHCCLLPEILILIVVVMRRLGAFLTSCRPPRDIAQRSREQPAAHKFNKCSRIFEQPSPTDSSASLPAIRVVARCSHS
jgi:hypothetical protein